MKQSIFEIRSNVALTDSVYQMVLAGDTSHITNCGQFVNIQLAGKFLRRPISVCDYDGETLTIVYKVVGKGTEQMAAMGAGEKLDILTGLGNGYDLTLAGDKPVLLGGGVGVPPMYSLAKKLRAAGKEAQDHLDFLAHCNQLLSQVVHGRHAHTAAQQHRLFAGQSQIIAVAQTGEDVQLGTGGHGGHGFGALANHLVDDGERLSIIVADRNGAAQEHTSQLDVDELTAIGDMVSITGQNHFIDRIRQRFVADNLKNALFHTFSLVVVFEILL